MYDQPSDGHYKDGHENRQRLRHWRVAGRFPNGDQSKLDFVESNAVSNVKAPWQHHSEGNENRQRLRHRHVAGRFPNGDQSKLDFEERKFV